MYQAIENFFNLDHMGPVIDSLMKRLDVSIKEDLHFVGKVDTDYGYNYSDWQMTDDVAWGNHVSFGIKPYIEDRMNSALFQMDFKHSVNGLIRDEVQLFPNPVAVGEMLYLSDLNGVSNGDKIIIYNALGIKVRELELHGSGVKIEGLSEGIYLVQIGSMGMSKVQIRLN
jgi:hypothetical protein